MIENNIDWDKIKAIFNDCINKIMRMEMLIKEEKLYRENFEHQLIEYIKKIKNIDEIKYCKNESIVILDNISINSLIYKELKTKIQNLIVVDAWKNFSLEILKNNKNFDIALIPFGLNNKSCLIFLRDKKYNNIIDSFLNHGSDGKDNCIRIGTNGYIDFFEIIYLYSVLKYINSNLSIKGI